MAPFLEGAPLTISDMDTLNLDLILNLSRNLMINIILTLSLKINLMNVKKAQGKIDEMMNVSECTKVQEFF